eukprot:scaffold1650_cov135-Cylindrotheca_fusiformis.AAC.3
MLQRVIAPQKALLFLLLAYSDGYRIGDSVETMLWTNTGATALKLTEMPMFGEFSRARIEMNQGSFSFGFEDGLYVLPWIEAKNLKKITVVFVFSRSGHGAIHSVSTSSERGISSEESSFEVEYIWVEEAPVQLQAGIAAMFLGTLVASLLFMLQACIVEQDDEGNVPCKEPKSDLRRYDE